MRLYVASSWRNDIQPSVVRRLLAAGHEVYDFRKDRENTAPTPHVFAWTEIDDNWEWWSNEEFIANLWHPAAVAGFACDFEAMEWAEAGVLVLPCGRSAHIEAGWLKGSGRPLHLLLPPDPMEPELMYKMADGIHASFADLLAALEE